MFSRIILHPIVQIGLGALGIVLLILTVKITPGAYEEKDRARAIILELCVSGDLKIRLNADFEKICEAALEGRLLVPVRKLKFFGQWYYSVNGKMWHSLKQFPAEAEG